MSLSVDSTLEHLKYAAASPAANPATNKVFGPLYRNVDSVNFWRDENGNEFSDQFLVKTLTASATLNESDRKTIQLYTGTGAATITIPASGTTDYTAGAIIRIVRGATAGALNIAFAGTPTLLAPFDVSTGGLYQGEAIELINLAADTWHVRALNDAQIRIQPYWFGTAATWTASLGTTGVDVIQLTPAIQSGTLAVGGLTEESGGYFALEAGAAGVASTTTNPDPHGIYQNAIFLRRPLDGSATAGRLLSINDAGTDRLVFGLLHCPTGTADGTAIDATNYWISVVYEDATGTLINTTANGDLQFEMLRAVAGQDYPYPV